MMKEKRPRLRMVPSVNRTSDSSSAPSLDSMLLKKRKKYQIMTVISLWDVAVVGRHDEEEAAVSSVQCEQDV